jgi:hypothetical protein
MLHYVTVFLLTLTFLGPSWAQDERYYRQILKGQLPELNKESPEASSFQFNVKSPAYLVDLNGDGIEESIYAQKRDGVDWIEIKNSSQRTLFEAKLLAMGGESHLYKINLVHITPQVKTLILFLDEGGVQGKRFESTARVFFVTYENNDLSRMKFTIGPHFYHEKESQRDQYFRRDYMVSVVDLDNDGKREISIHYNHIQRIFVYKGNGEWKRY